MVSENACLVFLNAPPLLREILHGSVVLRQLQVGVTWGVLKNQISRQHLYPVSLSGDGNLAIVFKKKKKNSQVIKVKVETKCSSRL